MNSFKSYWLLLVFITLFTKTSIAQGIQIGDNCPDVEIKQIINYPSGTARLSDFKGKALLIDFWFSACTACIEVMPKLDSLQREYGKDLQILLVNYESEEMVRNTFKKIQRINGVNLPSVVSDTLLNLLFPHRSSPHEIWIDKNGKVKAITDHVSVKRKNIEDLIAGKEMNLPLKKDDMEYSSDVPLVTSSKNEVLLRYSCITTYQPGLSGSIGMNLRPDNSILQARAKNAPLQELYIMAYGQWAKDFHNNRVILDLKDSIMFKPNSNNSHLFCYDSWWKDTSQPKALKEMQHQLDIFFNIRSNMKKRETPCLVLKRISGTHSPISEDKKKRADSYIKNNELVIVNVRLKQLIENRLNYGLYAWAPFQFIDETGITERVSFVLPTKFESIDQVNKYLKKYGLELFLERRLMDVIVLSDNMGY